MPCVGAQGAQASANHYAGSPQRSQPHDCSITSSHHRKEEVESRVFNFAVLYHVLLWWRGKSTTGQDGHFFQHSSVDVDSLFWKDLEPPTSLPIQLVETSDGFMNAQIVEATEKEWTGLSLGSYRREDSAAYADALRMSRTFVMTDSYFSRDSILADPSSFLEHGVAPLKHFYELGGTIVIMCVEGIYSIGSLLLPIFGCEWELVNVDSEHCTPTQKAREFFGTDIVEKLYGGKGHFISAPEEEGLYHIEVLDYEEYKSDHHGLCSDEEYSDDELETCRKAYESYVQRNKNQFILALHENDKGGRIVWMGDRNQEDRTMRAIFTKICCQEMNQP